MYNRCPLAFSDNEWVQTINIINMAGGEMGMGMSPSMLLDETTFFHNVKYLLSRIQGEIERYKQEYNKDGRSD